MQLIPMLDLLNHQSYGSPSNTLVNEAGTVVGYSKIATVAYETVRDSAPRKCVLHRRRFPVKLSSASPLTRCVGQGAEVWASYIGSVSNTGCNIYLYNR